MNSRSNPQGPLAGVRIIDWTEHALGPVATQILGDMGADVIKIESPSGSTTRQMGPARNPKMSANFLGMNRNKRSIVLNLKRPEAMEALMKLVETADVFVTNVRQKAANRRGISYETLAARNSKIIYAYATGYRQDSFNQDRAAMDDVIQGESGVAGMFHWGGGQPRYAPTNLADKLCGYVLASAVSMALFSRERTGEGQELCVPMLETMMSFNLLDHLWGYTFDPPLTPLGYVRGLMPNRRPFATQDGYICVIAVKDDQWKRFLSVLGRPEVAEDERFAKQLPRMRNIQELYGIVAEQLKLRTSAEWRTLLEAADIPNGPMNALDDLPNDPYVVSTGFFVKYDHPSEGPMVTTAIPVQFSRTKADLLRHLPPTLGQHTKQVLGELGYSEHQIAAMSS